MQALPHLWPGGCAWPWPGACRGPAAARSRCRSAPPGSAAAQSPRCPPDTKLTLAVIYHLYYLLKVETNEPSRSLKFYNHRGPPPGWKHLLALLYYQLTWFVILSCLFVRWLVSLSHTFQAEAKWLLCRGPDSMSTYHSLTPVKKEVPSPWLWNLCEGSFAALLSTSPTVSGLSLSSVVTYICVSASHVIVEFRRGRGGGAGDSSRCKHHHHPLLFCDNFTSYKCSNLLVRLRGVEVLLGGGRGVVRLQGAVRRHAVSPRPDPGDSST